MVALFRMVLSFWLCCTWLFPLPSRAQSVSLAESELQLKTLFYRISQSTSDAQKLALTDSISDRLYQTLLLPGSFEYPFKALQTLGKVTSGDKKIRIYTWNLPHADGTNNYYGFLQQTSGQTPISVIRFIDKRTTITEPTTAQLSADNWYGCLVYSIIEHTVSGITWYTLLGYNPSNLFISEKIVDLLWFDEQHNPVFGKAVFHYQKQLQHRIIFRYSAKVSMSLLWNEKMNMIIFDHLSPSKPSYTGSYQHYGPDLSYDGLRFEKGIWESTEDIDVRNTPLP
jgi:hypothetical protein